MGRDGVLPGRPFARLDPRRNTAAFSIALVGIIGFAGAFLFNFERGTDVLNFGAFVAFMGVNVAAFRQFYLAGPGGRGKILRDALAPLLGLATCLAIWWSLPGSVMLLGSAWILGGLVIAAVKTQGFRAPPVLIDLSE
jgi:putrescine importer